MADIGDFEDILNELAALGMAIDALGVYLDHSGSIPSGENIVTLGLMIQSRVSQAKEILYSKETKEEAAA